MTDSLVFTSVSPTVVSHRHYEVTRPAYTWMLPPSTVCFRCIPRRSAFWSCCAQVSGTGTHWSRNWSETRADPDASPEDVLKSVNAVIVDNVRNRLGGAKHMT